MYVCLCNGVSDKNSPAVRQFHPQSFQQLRKFIPVGNQCGKCIRAARRSDAGRVDADARI